MRLVTARLHVRFMLVSNLILVVNLVETMVLMMIMSDSDFDDILHRSRSDNIIAHDEHPRPCPHILMPDVVT